MNPPNEIIDARILEIGCASGYFSEVLRTHGMYVYGVEKFSTEAQDNNHVDDFYHGSVENFCSEKCEELQSSFDVIVLGDVIEHLIDPSAVLQALSNFLKNNGVFVASVPNITHKGIQSMLKDGQWIYQKYGLLDSTHMRFFSWRSLRELFLMNGFGIDLRHDICLPQINVYPLSIGQNESLLNNIVIRIKRIIPTFIKKIIKSVVRYFFPRNIFNIAKNKDSETEDIFQFVIRASREALNNHAFVNDMPKKLLVVTNDLSSSLSEIRLKIPLELYAKSLGGSVLIKQPEQVSKEDIECADILIVHRELSLAILHIINVAYKLGMSVVYDIDDNLFCLPESSMCKLQTTHLTQMEYVISIANRVTCPVQPLQKHLEKQSDNVYIVPNVICSDCTAFSVSEKQNSINATLVIAYSDTVYVDFLVAALDNVCEIKSDIKIITIGNISSKFTHLPVEITMFECCSPAEFSNIINSIDNGIGLIPLDDSYFSSCKSPIKFFHYTSCGLVTVASNVQPYSDCMNESNGVLVENDPRVWAQAILDIVADVPRRQQILSEALKTWKSVGSDNSAVNAWEKVFKNTPKKYEKNFPIKSVPLHDAFSSL